MSRILCPGTLIFGSKGVGFEDGDFVFDIELRSVQVSFH